MRTKIADALGVLNTQDGLKVCSLVQWQWLKYGGQEMFDLLQGGAALGVSEDTADVSHLLSQAHIALSGWLVSR